MGTEQEGARERCEAFQLGVYRHYKGGEYVAFVTSLDEASGEPFVHYYSLSFKKRWTRFMSVFFEQVPARGAPIGTMQERFRFVREASPELLLMAAGLNPSIMVEKPEAPSAPVPMLLTCPCCGARHIDEGEFATRDHTTHACQICGMCWRPALAPTVGVRFLPGFKNEVAGEPHQPDLRRERRRVALNNWGVEVKEEARGPVAQSVMSRVPGEGR